MADDDAAINASNVTLDAAQLAELAPFGTERVVEVGDMLYQAGDDDYDFIAMLDSEAEIVRRGPDGEEVVVAVHGPGRFLGELNFLTGQRVYLSARVTKAGRVLAIDRPTFRRLMSQKPDLSDLVFRAFMACREMLRSGAGADAIRIIGSRYSSEAIALRSFANRSRLPHSWIDLEDIDDPAVLLAGIGALAE